MYFIDLNKLDVEKKYRYDTVLLNCGMPQNFADIQISELAKDFQEMFEQAIEGKQTDVPTDFHFELNGDGTATEEETENFLTIINLVLNAFFTTNIVAEKGRKREYRLAVPKKLELANVSLSLLKRAINHQCHYNVFNLHINYKDLTFVLCDRKEDNNDN